MLINTKQDKQWGGNEIIRDNYNIYYLGKYTINKRKSYGIKNNCDFKGTNLCTFRTNRKDGIRTKTEHSRMDKIKKSY